MRQLLAGAVQQVNHLGVRIDRRGSPAPVFQKQSGQEHARATGPGSGGPGIFEVPGLEFERVAQVRRIPRL